ncbi:hypothetical protein [Paenibacillus sp. FSL R10-2734]|uniref:hypothetical protein n=1 Tax=Paenibacillus sp. FSL R10-2734 TaxID=2954691 RepID=UPI0030D90951
MKHSIELLQEWNVKGEQGSAGYSLNQGILLTYPVSDHAVGWIPYGFERINDSAMDVMNWFGLFFRLHTEAEATQIKIKATFADDLEVCTTLFLAGAGSHDVRVRLTDFDIERAKANIWRFLQTIEIQGDAVLKSAQLKHGERLHVHADVRGKAGNKGDLITYPMTVYNCTDADQHVQVKQISEGWESLIADITPKTFILKPYEQKNVDVTVRLHDYMVPGGHEKTQLHFIANGDSGSAVHLELLTLCRLSHPHIYYNEKQWSERRELIKKHDIFQPGYQQIIEDAEGWIVKPPVPVGERDYCYETHEEHYIMSAAYAYALTGERKYAEKVAQFLKYFVDEETGYPRKKKGCWHSYVQEGHFFQHLAIPYDIIYDAGVLTPEDHKAVEKSFRIYMDILDLHIQNGHISNWLLSEITGAFYCALAIEDMERALRFAFGPGGSIEQLKYGMFNDGWWHECSVGYNTWVSSMYIHTAHALLPYGINVLHTHFPIPFNREVDSTYNGKPPKIKYGMYNEKWGGNRKSYVRIKDMFDATIPFLDYRGILFGMSDSDEKKLEGVHFGSTFDLAYTYYQDPEYIPVIRMNQQVDPIFGHAELPAYESTCSKNNAAADNIGLAMVRSQTAQREQREQIQAVLRYGSHGYAHGHFDRTELLSVMRYGRSFFNPEHVWWGYLHFMYKFYVQNSNTKNMVVVDNKMQVPADSKLTLMYSGQALQVVAVETETTWAYPPYGGMIYQEGETLEERCTFNACSLPPSPEGAQYGEISEYTESIFQKRVMAVTDDYIVLFDYIEGGQEHQYDCLFQIKGFRGLTADQLTYTKHTSQWNDNSLSDAQFITDCHWYDVEGTSTARFETIFGEGEDLRGTRSFYNEPGVLKMDVHTAWPRHSEQIIGRAAEDHGIAIPFEYFVEVDEQVAAQGGFGAWILGQGQCDVDIRDANVLTLRIKNHPIVTEQKYPIKSKQGLFWGEAYIVTSDGHKLTLSDIAGMEMHNTDPGYGIGKDYEGGRVTIVGNEYPLAIPASPLDHDQDAIIRVNLTGLDAVKFIGLIGADAFPGDEDQRRRTYGIRSQGNKGRFITVIEPYEKLSVIDHVVAVSENEVHIQLKDGRVQTLRVHAIESLACEVELQERLGDKMVREELAASEI